MTVFLWLLNSFHDFYRMRNRIVLHVGFWLAFATLDTVNEFMGLSVSGGTSPDSVLLRIAATATLCILPIKIGLSYLVSWLIMVNADKPWRWVRIIGSVLLAFIVAIALYRFLVVWYLLPHVYEMKTTNANLFSFTRVSATLADLGFIVGIVAAIRQLRANMRGKERERNLVREKLESELKFLRNQTNPHFLFNTLNNIYALSRKKSDEAPEAVMKLSKLLRFMLYESKKSSITIGEELRLIEDYIELEKMRYNQRLKLRFDKQIDHESQQVAPLILLPFIENAFKHGASETRFESFIDINLKLNNGLLSFTVVNSCEPKTEEMKENIGLANVRRQLELMYTNFNLDVQPSKERFSIALTVDLNSNVTV